MGFTSFIWLVIFSLSIILAGKYAYAFIGSGGCSVGSNSAVCEYETAADAARQLQHNDMPMPEPLDPTVENPDGTTSLVPKKGIPTTGASASTDDYRSRIPLSEPSRAPGAAMPMNDGSEFMPMSQGPMYDPVQLLNPIPNDRLMPISGAKDDPIKTRLDTAESMGLYQNILEKEMGQTSGIGANKNKFFEMGVRDSAYHLYGTAEGNSFDKQQQFGSGTAAPAQPKRINFEINYKELDQKMYADKQKYNGNFMAAAANGGFM